MIIDAIMWVAYGILGLMIERLPEADPNMVSYISSQFGALRSGLNAINWFFPIDQLYIVLGFVFVIELMALSTKVLFWISENLSLGLFKSPH